MLNELNDLIFVLKRFSLSQILKVTNRNFGREVGARSCNLQTRTTQTMITISVDGNISSGKSTLVSTLVCFFPRGGLISEQSDSINENHKATKLKIDVIPEPLEKWCNLEGFNLLEMFYKDPEKNNFLFQHYVQLTRLMDIVKGAQDDSGEVSDMHSGDELGRSLHLRIMERSLQNNRFCFLELAKKSEKIHPAEFAVLSEWYTWLESNMNLSLDLIIYLQTEPKTAYDRMKSRARAAEDLCPYQYLADLHESYEEWLIRDPKTKSHVIILDANQNKEEVAAECFLKLKEYFYTLTAANPKSETDASSMLKE